MNILSRIYCNLTAMSGSLYFFEIMFIEENMINTIGLEAIN
jgi:hypothetical protein